MGEPDTKRHTKTVAGGLVKNKVTARIFVAGDFGRCPIESTIPFETWTKGRMSASRMQSKHLVPQREFPTALVAMRATPRIRIRCISWSAVVDNADANAGASTSAECGSPDWRIV